MVRNKLFICFANKKQVLPGHLEGERQEGSAALRG